eukprot:GHVS01019899.1.p1 GENE.GHVS01019899.1~~GHVS01019899.1.p1  ORF type:complete len:224 (+),score=59.96 GHVS01019899.1:150-821(+)
MENNNICLSTRNNTPKLRRSSISPVSRHNATTGGLSPSDRRGGPSVPGEEEKRRFRVAWVEGLRQLAVRFDQWIETPPTQQQQQDDEEERMAMSLPQDILRQVKSADGIDRKFLALRNCAIELNQRNRQLKNLLTQRHFDDNRVLDCARSDLHLALQKLADLQQYANTNTTTTSNIHNNNTNYNNSCITPISASSCSLFQQNDDTPTQQHLQQQQQREDFMQM